MTDRLENYQKAKKNPWHVGKFAQHLTLRCSDCKTEIGKIELYQKMYLIKGQILKIEMYCANCQTIKEYAWPGVEREINAILAMEGKRLVSA